MKPSDNPEEDTPLLSLLEKKRHFCWRWGTMIDYNCACEKERR